MENYRCPNRHNHVSAWPAYDRELCPVCHKTYVLKKKEEVKKYQKGEGDE